MFIVLDTKKGELSSPFFLIKNFLLLKYYSTVLVAVLVTVCVDATTSTST